MSQQPPRILPNRAGGFLAISPEDAPIRLGVIGADEADAVREYNEAVARWTNILSRREPAPVPMRPE